MPQFHSPQTYPIDDIATRTSITKSNTLSGTLLYLGTERKRVYNSPAKNWLTEKKDEKNLF